MLQMDGRSVWLDKNSVVTACSTLSRTRDDDLRRRRSRSLKVVDRRRMDGALRPATQTAEPRPQAVEPRPQTDVQKMKTLDVKPERRRPTVRIQAPGESPRKPEGRSAGFIAGLQRSDSSPMIRHSPRQEGSVASGRPKESSVRDALRRVNTVHPKDSMRRMKLILVPVETGDRSTKGGSTSGDSLRSAGKGERLKDSVGKMSLAARLKASSAEILSSSADSPLTEALKTQQKEQQQQQQPKSLQQQSKSVQPQKAQQRQRQQQPSQKQQQQQQKLPPEQQQKSQQQQKPQQQQQQQQTQPQKQPTPPQQPQSLPISADVSSAESSPRTETKGTKLVKRLSLRKKMTLPLSPSREKSSKLSPSPTTHERPIGAELIVPLGTPTDEPLEHTPEVSFSSTYTHPTHTGRRRTPPRRAEPR